MTNKETSATMLKIESAKASFEKTSRRLIALSLLGTALVSCFLVSLLFTFSLVETLSQRNYLTVEHNADVLGRQISEAYHDISLVAKNPTIINALISVDREKTDPVLMALLLRTGGELAGILDTAGQEILGISSDGKNSQFKSQLNKQQIFRVISAGKGIIAGQQNLFIAIPIKYYGRVQGFLEVHYDSGKYVKKYLDPNFHYQIVQGSEEIVFSNISSTSFFYGVRPVKSRVDNVESDMALKQFSEQNPYVALFAPLLLFFLGLLAILVLLSFVISKRIAGRMVEPIRNLVTKVSSSQINSWVRCAPLGADQELEYLAEAFDQKTSELLEMNVFLEEKIKLRTDDYLKEKTKAEDALRMRSEFIANMSHEIRTPLNGILGMAEILAEEVKGSLVAEKIRIIQQSGQLLLSIINDILDFSKIESKQIVLESISFSIRSIVQNVIYSLEGQAEGKGVVLIKEIDSKLRDGVIGDPTRLSQVLFNLVGNAIKFTERGTVTVRVSENGCTEKSVDFEIAVIDSGIGIAEDRIDNLFEAFSQADGSITRRFGGSGLGLTISKQLVELMGGKIKVSSVLGEGSTFTVTLKLERSEAQKADVVEQKVTKTFSKIPNILLAEDNKVNQVIVIAFLKSLGLKCDVANDGLEAVEMAKRKQYDLVFMDMQMPHLDGLQATRKIKDMENYKDVMIVALTANAFNKHRQKCFDAGMIDYLSKPLTKKSLTVLLNKLLKEA